MKFELSLHLAWVFQQRSTDVRWKRLRPLRFLHTFQLRMHIFAPAAIAEITHAFPLHFGGFPRPSPETFIKKQVVFGKTRAGARQNSSRDTSKLKPRRKLSHSSRETSELKPRKNFPTQPGKLLHSRPENKEHIIENYYYFDYDI